MPHPKISKFFIFLLKYLPLTGAIVVPFITLWLFPGVRSWDVHTFKGWMKCLAAADGPPYSPCLPDPINYPSVGLYLSAGVMLLLQKLGCVTQDISVYYQRFLAGIDSLNLLVFYLLLRGLGIRCAAWWTLAFSLLPSTRAGASLWVQIDSVTQLFITLAFLCALRGLTAVDRAVFGKAQRYFFGLGMMISFAMLTKQLAVFALPPLLSVLLLLSYRLARRGQVWRVVLNLAGIVILTVVIDRSFPVPPDNYGSGFFYALTSGPNHAGILSAHGGNLFSLVPGDPARSSIIPIRIISFRGLTIYGIPLFLGIGWFVGLSTVFFLCGLRLAWAHRPLSPRGHILYALTFAAFLSVLMNTVLAGTHERYMYHYGFFVLPVLVTLVTLSRSYGQILIVSTFHLVVYGLFVYQILRYDAVLFPHEIVHLTLVFLNLASVVYMLVAVVVAAWSPTTVSFSLETRDRCRMTSRAIFSEACRSISRALGRLWRAWILIFAVTFIPYFIHGTLNIQPLISVDLLRLILWAIVAAIPYALAPLWQLPLIVLVLPLTALGVCEIFHAIMFRGRISVATVFVTVQTNWREVSEFTQVYFTAPVILGMLSYLVVVFLLWRELIGRRSMPRTRALVAFLGYFVCIFVALRGMAQPVIEPPTEDPREEAVKLVWPGVLGPFEGIFRALDQYKSESRPIDVRREKEKRGF